VIKHVLGLWRYGLVLLVGFAAGSWAMYWIFSLSYGRYP
jgi:hypothetical protein